MRRAASKKRGRGRTWLRRLAMMCLLLGGVLTGLYLYQPQRYDLFPRPLPASHPWTDPDSRTLFRPGTKVVVVTAHPDDSEFYIGGLLLRLAQTEAELTHIVLTDGDKGYYPFEDAEENRKVRQREQRTADAVWHARETLFFGYPDGRLFARPNVVDRLAKEFQRLQPDYILCFDSEYPPRLQHRDHQNAGEAAERAAHQAGGKGWLLRFSSRAPNYAFDVSELWPTRLPLLAIHRSQFYGERLVRIQGFVEGRAIQHGKLLGVAYAEAVRCTALTPHVP